MLTYVSVLQMSNTAFHILNFFALQFNFYNLNQQVNTILLKSQYYNTPAPSCFRLHWPIIMDHTIVQNSCLRGHSFVPSVQQKSSGQKFSKSRTGSHVTYSCHHNLSRFTFSIFVHSWRFSVFHSLQSITPHMY